MQRHKLGLTAGTTVPMCDWFKTGAEPTSTPVEYETTGEDLDGVPIESGFGTTTWSWDLLPQEDYYFLLEQQGDVPGKTMYLHTSKRSGAAGIEFGDYEAIAKRPTFERREGLICYGVTMEFAQMVAA